MTTTPHQDGLPVAIAPHPLLQDALFCYAAGDDGAHAVLVRGWEALYQKLQDDTGIEASDEALNDIGEWSKGGDWAPYSFSLNFEGDWVSIYRITESTAQQLPVPDAYATEICRLRNVIQAACIGGTDMMLERWKALFPDAPVPTVKAQPASPEREPKSYSWINGAWVSFGLTPADEEWINADQNRRMERAFEAGYRRAEKDHGIAAKQEPR